MDLALSRITQKAKRKLKSAERRIAKVRIRELRKNHPNAKTLRQAEQRKEGRPLTEKQKAFVREWANGETIRSACARAELHHSEGYRLARDPAILKVYNEEKRLFEEAAQTTKKRVMDMMHEAYEHAKMIDEPASMVAAAREIGKLCGYYEQKITVEHKVGGKLLDRLVSMSDEELLKIIHEGSGDLIIGEAMRIEEPALLEAKQ